MTVVPAKIEDRAALVHQSIECDAFNGQSNVERGGRFAGVFFSADVSFRNRLEILRDQSCRLRGNVVEGLLVEIERRLCSQFGVSGVAHFIEGAIATSSDSLSSP